MNTALFFCVTREEKMLYRISSGIAKKMATFGIVSQESVDTYVYGIELLVSFFFSAGIIITIGLIAGKIIETIVFLSVFIILRSFTGGFHANTFIKCTIITLLTYGIVLLLSCFITIPLPVYLAFTLIELVLISIFAPIENINKPIKGKKRIRHKVTSIVLLILFAGIGFLLNYFFNLKALGSTVFFSLVVDTLLLFPREKRKEE